MLVDSLLYNCGNTMSLVVTHYVPEPATAADVVGNQGGFVKRVVTYMITDDLELKEVPD